MRLRPQNLLTTRWRWSRSFVNNSDNKLDIGTAEIPAWDRLAMIDSLDMMGAAALPRPDLASTSLKPVVNLASGQARPLLLFYVPVGSSPDQILEIMKKEEASEIHIELGRQPSRSPTKRRERGTKRHMLQTATNEL